MRSYFNALNMHCYAQGVGFDSRPGANNFLEVGGESSQL